MSKALDAVVELLDLEQIELDIFRGRSPENERRQRVFGGQVAGQALVAAGRTVPEDRPVHSLHAYFIRPGDPTRAADLPGGQGQGRPVVHHAASLSRPARQDDLHVVGVLPSS